MAARWRDVEGRQARLRLMWTQALHWGAVLAAMNLVFVADVGQMMNADARALSVLTLLALGTLGPASTSLHAYLPRQGLAGMRGAGNRLARAIGAASRAGGNRPGSDHCTVLLARQTGKRISILVVRIRIA